TISPRFEKPTMMSSMKRPMGAFAVSWCPARELVGPAPWLSPASPCVVKFVPGLELPDVCCRIAAPAVLKSKRSRMFDAPANSDKSTRACRHEFVPNVGWTVASDRGSAALDEARELINEGSSAELLVVLRTLSLVVSWNQLTPSVEA